MTRPSFRAPGGAVPPGRGEERGQPELDAGSAESAEPGLVRPAPRLPRLSPAMPHFVARALHDEMTPVSRPHAEIASLSTPSTLLDALADARPGTQLPELLAGLAEEGWSGHTPGGLAFSVIETHPDEDKFRLGPHTKAPKLRGRDWPRVPPLPNRPRDVPFGPVFDKLADMLTLFYCCYEISCTFTIGDESGKNKEIPGTGGTDIKAALVVAWENADENKVGKQPHVGAWLDGAKLQEAVDARTGKSTEWDNIDNISFDLKRGVAGSTSESAPPSRSDLARRRARTAGSWKIKGPVVFKNRRNAIQKKRKDR